MTATARQEPRIPPRLLVQTFWVIQRAMVRWSRGRLGLSTPAAGRHFGMLSLETVGRRTGKVREAIVGYYEDGPNLVTLAMNGWGQAEPAWWLNLQARPDATVTTPSGQRQVRARVATGVERDRLWATFQNYPGWGNDLDGLAALRARETTVLVLEPRPEQSAMKPRKENTIMNASKLTNLTALSAIAAGLIFLAIQPLHPADTLASVTGTTWVVIHEVTLVMLTLFVVGISGIYASQVEKMGWVGLAGYLVLVAGLLLTATGAVIEAFVEPVVASSTPAFVEGMMGMVEGHPTGFDLGAIPTLWSASSACFLGGTILFGVANFRAGNLSRWASAVFALGLFLAAPAVGVLGLSPRLAAFPIGFGLAWLGYSLLTRRRSAGGEFAAVRTVPQASEAGAA